MEGSIVVIAGLATMFNFAILKWKFENNRVADAVLDLIVLGVITWSFAGSMTGMVIGVVGSMLFSLYLLRICISQEHKTFIDLGQGKSISIYSY